MPTSVRRRLAVASIALLVPALGACGFGEQTDQVYQPAVGVNDRQGTIDVLGAVIVSSEDGKGQFIASLVNGSTSRSDQLTDITGDGVQATVDQPVRLEPDSLLNMAQEGGGIEVSGSRVQTGNFVRLTLEFGNGQKTELNVPVVGAEGEFASITPAASPSATSSPSSSRKSSGTKSSGAKPSASPSGSASASASP